MDISAVEAAVRKHEAIETDIVAYSERVQAVNAVATELEAERYHDIKRVLARKNNVVRLWDYLRELVASRRERLLLNLDLQKMFQDLAYLMDWMEEMKVCGGSGAGSSLPSLGRHHLPPPRGPAVWGRCPRCSLPVPSPGAPAGGGGVAGWPSSWKG